MENRPRYGCVEEGERERKEGRKDKRRCLWHTKGKEKGGKVLGKKLVFSSSTLSLSLCGKTPALALFSPANFDAFSGSYFMACASLFLAVLISCSLFCRSKTIVRSFAARCKSFRLRLEKGTPCNKTPTVSRLCRWPVSCSSIYSLKGLSIQLLWAP